MSGYAKRFKVEEGDKNKNNKQKKNIKKKIKLLGLRLKI